MLDHRAASTVNLWISRGPAPEFGGGGNTSTNRLGFRRRFELEQTVE